MCFLGRASLTHSNSRKLRLLHLRSKVGLAGQDDSAWCQVLVQPQGTCWQLVRFMGSVFEAEVRQSIRLELAEIK